MSPTVKVRKWGNSLGVVLPKELVEQQRIRVDDEISIAVAKKADFNEIFGSLPRTMSGQDMKDMVRDAFTK